MRAANPDEFNFWIFDGFYRRGLTNPDIQQLIRPKEQGLGRVKRIGDSAQASDINQLNDDKIAMTGIEKVFGTKKENWDEWRAALMEQQGRIQKLSGKPKIFISSQLVDIDDDPMSKTFGAPFNFLVKELEQAKADDVLLVKSFRCGREKKRCQYALNEELLKSHQREAWVPLDAEAEPEEAGKEFSRVCFQSIR